jgi:hypothetical protein
METSIVGLRHKMRDILRALDRNETVRVLYHGKERALLVPSRRKCRKPMRLADHPFVGMWAEDKEKEDVAAYVRKLRQDRCRDL